MKGNKILAIDPGSRELGVAILNEQDLLYYGVKTIRWPDKRLECELTRLIGHLIARYQPKYIAIEQPTSVQQKATKLLFVIREIKALADRERLIVREYAPKDVRQFICRELGATKHETAQKICLYYPELAPYLAQRSRWEEMYYAHVFDAVAVGLMCQYDVRNKV